MTKRLKATVAAFALSSLAMAGPLCAQASQRVAFARGNDNAAVNGSVTGRQYRDYILGARAGQIMAVALTTKGSAYFNILPPGSNDVAIYNSSVDGNTATNIRLPSNGDYRIRVYLMGAAERGTRPVSYTLSMTVMSGK
jgi:hypothetical protein